MNKQDARKLGRDSAFELATMGDFDAEELSNFEKFSDASYEIQQNARQFAGDPTYDLASEPNSESLFDAYDEGEEIGIKEAWRARQQAKREARRLEREENRQTGDYRKQQTEEINETHNEKISIRIVGETNSTNFMNITPEEYEYIRKYLTRYAPKEATKPAPATN